ncbi:MAG: toprim domain-containing protein [Candidatus Paceibacterota bacterium]
MKEKTLIIVESPTRAKTISKFLPSNYKVESSFGHIRDLPKGALGVDVENDFTPQYVTPRKSIKRVNEIKKLASKSTNIILASDEDREGEAIAWHLEQIVKGKVHGKRPMKVDLELQEKSLQSNVLFFMKSPSRLFTTRSKTHATSSMSL